MTVKPFTLLELLVAITIVAIASTLAVSAYRGESPARKLENTALGFEAYCARVRYAAMEQGTDRVIAFDPAKRRFVAENPDDPEATSAGQGGSWELPADFELDSQLELSDSGERETVEVFRFFADGSANATREFILRYRKFQRVFKVSPLTGLLLSSEEAAEQ